MIVVVEEGRGRRRQSLGATYFTPVDSKIVKTAIIRQKLSRKLLTLNFYCKLL